MHTTPPADRWGERLPRRLGLGSAIGWLLFFLILAASLVHARTPGQEHGGDVLGPQELERLARRVAPRQGQKT